MRTRSLLTTARTYVDETPRLTPLRARLVLLNAREIRVVERIVWTTRRVAVRRLAMTVSWLGTGWVYLLLAGALLAWAGPAAWRGIVAAAACSLASHLVYPWVKRACRRPRPYEHLPALIPLLAPLDRHSFPSGHAMTMTAALLPLVLLWPGLWWAAALLWTGVAWSRLACAHHYPSDVLAGTLLGLAVAAPVCAAVL